MRWLSTRRAETQWNSQLATLCADSGYARKTSLVNLIARTLVAIEDVNGREVSLDVVREWTRSLAYGSLFGSWSVKVINELDRCSKDAVRKIPSPRR